MKTYVLLLALILFYTTGFGQNNYTYISPKPNSILVSNKTNIILRSALTIDRSSLVLNFIRVEGAQSGLHSGNLILSDDGRTIIFNPFKVFVPNEMVGVHLSNGIKTVDGKDIGLFEFSFKISPLKEKIDVSINTNSVEESYNTESALNKNISIVQADSLPSDFPIVTVGNSDNPYDGKVFIANKPAISNPPYGNYIIIADNNGSIIKYKKFTQAESNFKVLPNGELSLSENGRHIVMDTSLAPIDTFKCGNGYNADSHDFLLLQNGHALLFASDPEPIDMSQIVPGGNPDATVIGAVIQELDLYKNVVFQWRSWDYIPITTSYINLTAKTVDYVHGNALEVDKDGNIYFVMRHTSNVIKINRQTGDIDWTLGGKQNQFTFINEHESNYPNYFSFSHNINVLPDGDITLFDNGDQHSPPYSRGVEYKLDEQNKTATMVWEYRHSPDIYSSSGGSVQRLPNGNTIIGWSRGGSTNGLPIFTEVHPDNSVALEMFFPNGEFSYRSYKFPWVSQTPEDSVIVYEVLQGNTYTFNSATDSTGISITFNQLDADIYANAIVTKYNYAPVNPDFVENAPIMASGYFKIQEQLINSYAGEVHVDLNKYSGISLPSKTVVYARELYGEVFIPLSTSYDSIKNELVFNTNVFGDFAFGIPQSVTAYSPVPISPKNNEIVNGESSVNLMWGTRGIVQTYHLQVSTDSSFTNLVTDNPNLISTLFNLSSVNNNTEYFWRVNNSNPAGTSKWSDEYKFITTSPYISITYPNGGESIYIDSTYIIRWQTNVIDTLNIDLMMGNNVVSVVADSIVSRTNALNWRVPSSIQIDSSYKIKITSIYHSNLTDISENSFSIVHGVTGVSDSKNSISTYRLYQNYPNPFNPSTKISWQSPVSGWQVLKVFDVLGNEIATLVNEEKPAGSHEVEFNASNLASGIFFYQLKTGEFLSTRKMILLR